MARPRPPSGLTAVLTAARTTAAGALRGRRRLGLVLLVAIPVVIMALVVAFSEAGRGGGFAGFAKIVTKAYLGLILPLALISLGTGTFGDEWAGGTAHYVMGLPVSRAALVLGRWLACVRRALVLVLPAIAVVYLLCLARHGDAVLHYAGVLVLVLIVVSLLTTAYCALFMLVGLALKRSVMFSLVYIFVFEILIANLPQALAVFSLAFHARNLLGQITHSAVGRDAFRLATTDVGEVQAVPAEWSAFWILAVTALALLLATLLLRRKECGGEVEAGEASAT